MFQFIENPKTNQLKKNLVYVEVWMFQNYYGVGIFLKFPL